MTSLFITNDLKIFKTSLENCSLYPKINLNKFAKIRGDDRDKDCIGTKRFRSIFECIPNFLTQLLLCVSYRYLFLGHLKIK